MSVYTYFQMGICCLDKGGVFLLVECPSNMPVYLRDRSAQAIACAATLR